MFEVLSVGVGGFVGAALRYLISSGIARFMDSRLPLGTLCVNVFGGLLMGFYYAVEPPERRPLCSRMRLSDHWSFRRLTTFSTFSYETMSLIGEGAWITAAANAGLNLILSLCRRHRRTAAGKNSPCLLT